MKLQHWLKSVSLGFIFISVTHNARAAVISITDDGVNTTIAWRGSFDVSGLSPVFIFGGNFGGSLVPNYTSNVSAVSAADIVILDGQLATSITSYTGADFTISGGWTDPSGDSATPMMTTDSDFGFFINADSNIVGFTSSSDGAAVISGTLLENGFTANESIIINNPNVMGSNGQLTVQTTPLSTIPEPSSVVLITLGANALLLRRRRQHSA